MVRFSQNFDGGPNPGAPGNLLGRIVAFVVGFGVLALSLVLGAVVIAIVVGLVLLVSLAITVRFWWLQRKMARYQREHGDLEGEYTVISAEERITSRQKSRKP